MKIFLGVLVLLYLTVVGGLIFVTRFDPVLADERDRAVAPTAATATALRSADPRPPETRNVPTGPAPTPGANIPPAVVPASTAPGPNTAATPGETAMGDPKFAEPITAESKLEMDRQVAESLVDPAVVAQKDLLERPNIGDRRR